MSIPQVPDLPTLKILTTQIDIDLRAATGTQEFGVAAETVHNTLMELAASIPEPTEHRASDLEAHEHGKHGAYETESEI